MTAQRTASADLREAGSHPERRASVLSAQGAFVVHLSTKDGHRRRRFSGRVEHLSSGKSAYFSSLRALLAFLDSFIDTSAA
jgi:hypothetical protein